MLGHVFNVLGEPLDTDAFDGSRFFLGTGERPENGRYERAQRREMWSIAHVVGSMPRR